MIKVPAHNSVTLGLDVSHYQGLCDFHKLANLGVEFVIAKCTEYNVDETYANDRKSANDSEILFGAYHFFHPNHDPLKQAKLFLSMATPQKGDLRPMLDWETTDGVPNATDRQRAQIWLDHVEQATGKPPMIYLGPYFGQALALPQNFKRYPLVVAHYGTLAPLVPQPWDNWVIHQYSDKGQLPGIPGGAEDLDRFNGTLAQLQLLCL